ncbi:MAG: hypothetical protein R2865_06980 [Deinococcales bacterium]
MAVALPQATPKRSASSGECLSAKAHLPANKESPRPSRISLNLGRSGKRGLHPYHIHGSLSPRLATTTLTPLKRL